MLKNLPRITLLLAFILSYSSQSQAGLLIEPVVGYSWGKLNSELSGLVTEEDTQGLKGASYGGRLGYQNFGFQIGVDYLASSMVYSSVDDKLTTSEFGGFIGYELPILLRVYAGYIFSGTGTLVFDDSTLDDVKLKSGSGPKIGVGLTLLPFLDMNIEYRSITYSTNKDILGNTGVDADFNYNAVMVAFSLPFVL